MDKLIEARNNINAIDKEIAKLWQKRMHEVQNIVKYKKEHQLPIYDPIRENEVIKQNINYIQDEQLKVYYRDYLEMMMEISKAYQEEILEN